MNFLGSFPQAVSGCLNCRDSGPQWPCWGQAASRASVTVACVGDMQAALAWTTLQVTETQESERRNKDESGSPSSTSLHCISHTNCYKSQTRCICTFIHIGNS